VPRSSGRNGGEDLSCQSKNARVDVALDYLRWSAGINSWGKMSERLRLTACGS